MGKIKVVFIGNPLGGDDGIGPYLYDILKDDSELKDFELLELGVIGLDLLSYIDEGDSLIIVDALHTDKDLGKVVLLEEKDLKPELKVVSQHDFGIEETSAILRVHNPNTEKINIIGINVKSISLFSNELSNELLSKMDSIINNVKENIIKLSKS